MMRANVEKMMFFNWLIYIDLYLVMKKNTV